MFQWIACLIALLSGLVKLWRAEKITLVYWIITLIVAGCASIFIALIGGYLFPAEAVALTRANLPTVLTEHLFSAFVGSIISPLVQYIAGLKLE